MENSLVENKKAFFLSGNALKIIGAIFMLIDHIGYMFFPKIELLRVIGRLSFPIFAYMIAEGSYYTKHKLRYFIMVFILGVICQVAYELSGGGVETCVLITFALSILIVYALQFFKDTVFNENIKIIIKCLSILPLIISVLGAFFIDKYIKLDYGFFGALAPAFASLFKKPKTNSSTFFNYLDNKIVSLISFGICLLLIAISMGKSRQFYSLLGLIPLIFYSGRRGQVNLKYFFYIFYPTHLAVLYLIQILIAK